MEPGRQEDGLPGLDGYVVNNYEIPIPYSWWEMGPFQMAEIHGVS